MDVDKLIYEIKYRQIKNLVPVSVIRTDEDIEKYRKRKYNVVRVDKLRNSCLGLNDEIIDNLYYDREPLGGILYYDLDEMLLFNTDIYIKENEIVHLGAKCDILECIGMLKGLYNSGDYETAFEYVPEAYRVELVSRCLDKINIENRYDTFIKCYKMADFGSYHLNSEILEKVLEAKTDEQKMRTRAELDKITEKDVLTVYRGIGDKSNERGFSYSLSFDIAMFFAFRHSVDAEYVIITEAQVKKNDVIEFITGGESEILLNPDNLINEMNVAYDGIKGMTAEYPEVMEVYMKERERGARLFNKIDKKGSLTTNSDLDKGLHNRQHMLRVLYLCIILAEMCDVDIKLRDSLYTAAMFHDIGRDNDNEDREHGAKSYKILCSVDGRYKRNKLLEKLMTYHCIEDIEWEKDWKAKEQDKLLLKILKDADALDRQRFGLGDLKTKYLRLENSRSLLFTAFQLTKCKM